MSIIQADQTIEHILKRHPESVVVFEQNGMPEVADPAFVQQAGRFLKLGSLLQRKGLNESVFLRQLDAWLTDEQTSVDITLRQEWRTGEGAPSVAGLLPCPVRLPLLEAIEPMLTRYRNEGRPLSVRLEAASGGFDWIREDLAHAESADALPDLFLSAGFDIFFEQEAFGKYVGPVYHDPVPTIPGTAMQDLADPLNLYGMLAVVPAVFLVNMERLGDREEPKTWEDILNPRFEREVALPIDDFDLFHALLITLHHRFGDSGIRQLSRNMLVGQHPSEMVKSGSRTTGLQPTITVIPYFFTRMVERVRSLAWVWPSDGAVVSPIFLIAKRDASPEVNEMAAFLKGPAIGGILSSGGLFPALQPDVKNEVPDGAMYQWIGWDRIRSMDVTAELARIGRVFRNGIQDGS